MTESNGALVQFAKRVGIICGAAIAAGTVLQFLGGFLWGQATRPIVEAIKSEREARQAADSLIVGQIAKLAESSLYPLGSSARERAVRKVIDAPEALEDTKP